MNQKKSTKRTLITSALSLVLCMAMLIGTTFAWFTDSVVSEGNIIKAGKLDAELNYKTALAEEWKDASEGAIFNYDLWEPGYVDAKYVQVANIGNLAFKYRLNIVPETPVAEGEVNLADVIDVYIVAEPTEDITRGSLASIKKVGTLSQLMADADGAAYGILLPKEGSKEVELAPEDAAIAVTEQVTLGIALKMQEEAGNEYQELSVGGGFRVELLATQYTWENDNFDNQYDANAKYEGEVGTVGELQAALNKGGKIKVLNDINVTGKGLVVPADVSAVLEMNGNVIISENHKSEGAVLKNEGKLTVNNGTITSNGANGGSAINNSGTLIVNNSVLNGAPNADGSWPSYTVNNSGVMTVNDSTITSVHGAVASYGDGAVVTLNNTDIDMTGIPGFTSHGIYVYSNGAAIVNGGNIANNAADQASTGGSVINGAVTVNGGIFTGRVENYSGTPVIKGGTFTVKPNDKFVAEGYSTIAVGDKYLVADVSGKTKVVDGLYSDEAGAYYVYTGEALEKLNQGWSEYANKSTVINLEADIDFAGHKWTPVDSHADIKNQLKEINGNGYTIKNLTIDGQAMFKRFAGTGNVTIKDVTFDNAAVESTGINASILTVQSYQNVLLDNVDVKNSVITGTYKVAPLIATVYNESNTTVTATLKNCDVTNTTVKATQYDFCTTGMVAFVYAGNNDKVEFENCTITNVKLMAPNDGYKAHAWVYTTGSESLFNEAEGVTVTNCTFEAL